MRKEDKNTIIAHICLLYTSFKRKFEKTGIVKELRSRQQFDKPSVTKRLKKERAVYVQKLQQVEVTYNQDYFFL